MSDNIYLNREEQVYLMEMLELNNVTAAWERFSTIMVEEKADPTKINQYLKKIMGSPEKLEEYFQKITKRNK